jgi:hypothetical protein
MQSPYRLDHHPPRQLASLWTAPPLHVSFWSNGNCSSFGKRWCAQFILKCL